MTEYKLVHVTNRDDYAVPDVDMEDKFLRTGWWRKQSRSTSSYICCQEMQTKRAPHASSTHKYTRG